MKKLFYIVAFSLVCFFTFSTRSQTLGGYTIYDYLVSATHPTACDPSYVTLYPDDSIWVNFDPNDVMTGNFSMPSTDQAGADLLLETGFHASNYTVSLLLSSGIYSIDHNVTVSAWTTITPPMTWQYMGLNCYTSFQTANHYIIPLDFMTDFGLSPTDTVVGIKIIFLQSSGATDFAGAYIVSQQSVGFNEQVSKPDIQLSPIPFSDHINITGTNQYNLEFNLYDLSSRKILHREFTGSATFNTPQLAKGIYIYEIRNSDMIIKQGKIVKDH